MNNWSNLGAELEDALRLKTKIISYRRLEKAEELDAIKDVVKMDSFFCFCQVPFLVRVNRWTVGITKKDNMAVRCARIFGLRANSEKATIGEAAMMATTWFRSQEDALLQQGDYCRIPAGEAVVLAPLTMQKFEPEALLIYATPAQVMMILCALMKEKYEKLDFSFISEGSCSDSLAKCYVTGKPAVSIPCYGERAIGGVGDDEIGIAFLPSELDRIISGLKALFKAGLTYPITVAGPSLDPTPLLARNYPSFFKR